MSEVVKAIVPLDLGERKYVHAKKNPLFEDVFKAKAIAQDTYNDMGFAAKRYRIEVRLGADAYISEDDQIHDCVKRTKRQVIEGIFGEFRPHFRRIEKAIYDYDYHEAGKLLHEMEHKMFEEYE